jgi:hypothetical protein
MALDIVILPKAKNKHTESRTDRFRSRFWPEIAATSVVVFQKVSRYEENVLSLPRIGIVKKNGV